MIKRAVVIVLFLTACSKGNSELPVQSPIASVHSELSAAASGGSLRIVESGPDGPEIDLNYEAYGTQINAGAIGIYSGSWGGKSLAMQISGTGAPELVLVNNGSVTGRIEPETGCADMAAGYKVSGVRVIGPRQPGINDAQSLEEVTARLNEVLAVLRAHGLIEPKGVVLTAKE